MSTTPPCFTRTAFRKSSYSQPNENCVDAYLAFTKGQFDAFLDTIR